MRRALGGLDPEQCVLPVKTQVKWQVDDWAPVKTRKDFHPLVCVCVFLLKCYCVYCFFFWFRVEFFVKTFIRSKFKTYMLHFEAEWGTALEKWVAYLERLEKIGQRLIFTRPAVCHQQCVGLHRKRAELLRCCVLISSWERWKHLRSWCYCNYYSSFLSKRNITALLNERKEKGKQSD